MKKWRRSHLGPVFCFFPNASALLFKAFFYYYSFLQAEQSQKGTPQAGTEGTPVKRRGRPPKSAASAPAVNEKEAVVVVAPAGAGRGRKRAADSNSSTESINIKMSKQQQIDLQRWAHAGPCSDSGKANVFQLHFCMKITGNHLFFKRIQQLLGCDQTKAEIWRLNEGFSADSNVKRLCFSGKEDLTTTTKKKSWLWRMGQNLPLYLLTS